MVGTAGSRCSQQGPGGQGALGGQCDWNRQCGELWGGRAGQVWMAGRGRVRRGQGLSGPAPPASLETAQSTQSLGDGRLKIPRRSAQGHTHTHTGDPALQAGDHPTSAPAAPAGPGERVRGLHTLWSGREGGACRSRPLPCVPSQGSQARARPAPPAGPAETGDDSRHGRLGTAPPGTPRRL